MLVGMSRGSDNEKFGSACGTRTFPRWLTNESHKLGESKRQNAGTLDEAAMRQEKAVQLCRRRAQQGSRVLEVRGCVGVVGATQPVCV
jgi:hypothetical protein